MSLIVGTVFCLQEHASGIYISFNSGVYILQESHYGGGGKNKIHTFQKFSEIN